LDQDINPISEQDKAGLRAELVPGMIVLSTNPADKTIRAQIAEAVSLIAELDFPEKWDSLVDVRCLSPHFFLSVFLSSSFPSHPPVLLIETKLTPPPNSN